MAGEYAEEVREMMRFYPVYDGKVAVRQAVRVDRRLQNRWRRTRRVVVMGKHHKGA